MGWRFRKRIKIFSGFYVKQVSQEQDSIEEIKSIALYIVQQEYNKNRKTIEDKKLLQLLAKKNNNMKPVPMGALDTSKTEYK